MTRRRLILLTILGALLALTVAWSYQYMVTQKEAALAARNDLAEGLGILGRIEQISRQPTLATDREKLTTETTTLIETAAQAAQILPASLKRISPEAPRRVGDTVYKEKPTRVMLQSVSLRQLAGLAAAAPLEQAGLNVESIRLTAGREADAADLWDAELVLTYLVYDPPQAGK